jgi:branched-chain amino acid transport system substrate-binding protein
MFNRLRRSAVVLTISAVTLGTISAGVFIGSAGAGASGSTPGVTAKTITIGATVPLSGLAVGYAEVSAAAAAVFSYVNHKGGINGRKINYIRKDDCYNIDAAGCTANVGATPTLTQTQTLVTQNNVFAEVGSLGTAAQDSVLAYLNQNKVPDLFVSSGSSDWNQPKKYPALFGYQPSYRAEGKIFAAWIKKNESGATVGIIGQGDDFGLNGLAGLIAGGLTIATANRLTYNPANLLNPTALQAELVQDLTVLKTNNATVVVLDSIPPVTQGILAIAHQLSFTPQWVISSVGSDPISVATPLEVGAVTTNYFPSTATTSNPWNAWIKKVIHAAPNASTTFPNYFTGANAGVLDANMQYGAGYAVAFCEVLKSLGKNVTRAGFLKAMTTVKLSTPSLVPLAFTKGQHQGMQGGSMAKVVANTVPTSPPQYAVLLGNAEYTTGDYANTKIATNKQMVTPIPSWLK